MRITEIKVHGLTKQDLERPLLYHMDFVLYGTLLKVLSQVYGMNLDIQLRNENIS